MDALFRALRVSSFIYVFINAELKLVQELPALEIAWSRIAFIINFSGVGKIRYFSFEFYKPYVPEARKLNFILKVEHMQKENRINLRKRISSIENSFFFAY